MEILTQLKYIETESMYTLKAATREGDRDYPEVPPSPMDWSARNEQCERNGAARLERTPSQKKNK